MELLHQCRDKSLEFYASLFLQMLEQADNQLFEMAEKAGNNRDQTRFFEAMQEVRGKSSGMTRLFDTELAQIFDNFLQQQGTASADDEDDDELNLDNLSLVDKEDLEDSLAISIIVNKANNRFSEELWKLNRRIAVLRGGAAVDDESNPIGPTAVCNAFRVALKNLEIENAIVINLYKLFGKLLLKNGKRHLDSINSLLKDGGVLPNISYSLVKQQISSRGKKKEGEDAEPEKEQAEEATPAPPAPSAPEPPPKSGPEPSPEPHPQARADRSQQTSGNVSDLAIKDGNFDVFGDQRSSDQQELISNIRRLQSKLFPNGNRRATASGVNYGEIATDGLGGEDTFSETDYAFALTAVQEKSVGKLPTVNDRRRKMRSIDEVERHLIDQLSSLSQGTDRRKMRGADADVIDLVGLLFNYMLDDPKLPATVKTLLSHLHTPFLKVALIDREFFSRPEHPARRLLNAMAGTAVRWMVDEDGERTVYPKLQNVVETILKEFVDDISLFDDLLADFSRFATNLSKRASLAEKRSQEAEKGLERLARARTTATREVADRLKDKEVPEVTRALLENPWTDFLSFHLLRHGDEGAAWENALKVIDGVIWSVQPVADNADVERFKKIQSKLESSIRFGLVTIGYDSQKSNELLAGLADAQEQALKGVQKTETDTATQQLVEEVRESSADTVVVAPVEEDEPLSSEEQLLDDNLQSIDFGTWFEFDDPAGEDEAQMLKLAWYSPVSAHYMFVNKAGIKSKVIPRVELVRGLSRGLVREVEVDSRSFMERALESIFKSLKIGS